MGYILLVSYYIRIYVPTQLHRYSLFTLLARASEINGCSTCSYLLCRTNHNTSFINLTTVPIWSPTRVCCQDNLSFIARIPESILVAMRMPGLSP